MAPELPVSLNLTPRRGRYDKAEVDRVLADMVVGYEQLGLERDDLRAQIEALEDELARFRELDRALRDSLLAGQQTATKVIREAEARAKQIIEEADAEGEHYVRSAKAESEEITRTAIAERDRIQQEVERLTSAEAQLHANYRAFLLAALNVLEDDPSEAPATPEAEIFFKASSKLEARGAEAEQPGEADAQGARAPDQKADDPNAEAQRTVG